MRDLSLRSNLRFRVLPGQDAFIHRSYSAAGRPATQRWPLTSDLFHPPPTRRGQPFTEQFEEVWGTVYTFNNPPNL